MEKLTQQLQDTLNKMAKVQQCNLFLFWGFLSGE